MISGFNSLEYMELIVPELESQLAGVKLSEEAAASLKKMIVTAARAASLVRRMDLEVRESFQPSRALELMEMRQALTFLLTFCGGPALVGDSLAAEIARAADRTITDLYPDLRKDEFRAQENDC